MVAHPWCPPSRRCLFEIGTVDPSCQVGNGQPTSSTNTLVACGAGGAVVQRNATEGTMRRLTSPRTVLYSMVRRLSRHLIFSGVDVAVVGNDASDGNLSYGVVATVAATTGHKQKKRTVSVTTGRHVRDAPPSARLSALTWGWAPPKENNVPHLTCTSRTTRTHLRNAHVPVQFVTIRTVCNHLHPAQLSAQRTTVCIMHSDLYHVQPFAQCTTICTVRNDWHPV